MLLQSGVLKTQQRAVSGHFPKRQLPRASSPTFTHPRTLDARSGLADRTSVTAVAGQERLTGQLNIRISVPSIAEVLALIQERLKNTMDHKT